MNNDSIGHIFVAAHEVCELPQSRLYKPILVGASLRGQGDGQDLPEAFLRDDLGDNISGHNDCLSELTALYWVWKNRCDPFLGLAHYRRFFVYRYPFGYPFRYNGCEDWRFRCAESACPGNWKSAVRAQEIMIPE